jgi:hypothetical protein
VQVVAVADEGGMRRDVDLDVQVAGRSAARSNLALTAELDAGAGVDTGGIFTVMARRARTLPSPAHSLHGSGISDPKPRQAGQGRAVRISPRNERWVCRISPRP